jgi:nitroreductase
MTRSRPADLSALLSTAVEQALQAPSVHNTQPWRWRITSGSIELHADEDRHLAATDPDRRDLLLSCGAALHHLQVALAALDLPVRVHRLPDPENLDHLATVEILPSSAGPADTAHRTDRADAALADSIDRRRTERRRMSHRPVPAGHLAALGEQAARLGAQLLPVTDPTLRQRLVATLTAAAHDQDDTPGCEAELRMWTRRYAGAHDGIPAANVSPPPVGLIGVSPLRRFPRATLTQPPQQPGHGSADDAAELLVITTPADDPLDRLRAGEATSAVLLTATGLGLACTPLSQALEVDTSRQTVQIEVLHTPDQPQLILRIGWPADGSADLPAAPRRALHSVLLPDS